MVNNPFAAIICLSHLILDHTQVAASDSVREGVEASLKGLPDILTSSDALATSSE